MRKGLDDTMSEHKKIERSSVKQPQPGKQSNTVQQNPLIPESILLKAQLGTNTLSSHDVMQLQSLIGNRAVRQLYAKTKGSEEAPVQRQANQTGLPDNLKAGIEGLSGIAMDDVTVHYNSSVPSTLQAYAYTQGSDIHVAPGQERHLPHEAWHVVQQKQGRVTPTMQMRGFNINDDTSLEREADTMGSRALSSDNELSAQRPIQRASKPVVQRWQTEEVLAAKTVPWGSTSNVTTIGDPDRHVCFFFDGGGDPLVVKVGNAAQEDAGLYDLIADMQETMGIASARMFKADDKEREQIVTAIKTKADLSSFKKMGLNMRDTIAEKKVGTDHKWNAAVASHKRAINNRVEGFASGPIYVSSFAKGVDGDKLAERARNNMLNRGNAQDNQKDIFYYLKDAEYMKKVGKLTAIDCFMGFEDRALSGNIGNWMTGDTGQLTLIDNIDNKLKSLWQTNQSNEYREDIIEKIKPENIFKTAKEVYEQILDRVYGDFAVMEKEELKKSQGEIAAMRASTKAKIKEKYNFKAILEQNKIAITYIRTGLLEGRNALNKFANSIDGEWANKRQSMLDNATARTNQDKADHPNDPAYANIDYRARLLERISHMG